VADDYSSYIKSHIKRLEKEKKETEILFQEYNNKARDAARLLGDTFNVKRVYLFGSLANRNFFRLNSDVDLAVEGLKSEEYIDAWGELEKIFNHNFDLVQIERANEQLRKTIEKEGVIIYESRRDESQ